MQEAKWRAIIANFHGMKPRRPARKVFLGYGSFQFRGPEIEPSNLLEQFAAQLSIEEHCHPKGHAILLL